MLYARWREIARQQRDEWAVIDSAAGGRWTFAQLLTVSDALPIRKNRFIAAEGKGIDYILQILQAWKSEVPLLPVEPGQKVELPAGELPEHCVHLKMTSGTTAKPRFVSFDAHQIAADARNIVSTMGLRPDAPNLAAISLAHSYGFSNLITPLLLHGIPLILAASPLPENIRAEAGRFKQVTLPSVPALWQVWAQARCIPSNVAIAISAGAPLPIVLESEVWREFGLKLRNFYGSSECGGIAYDKSSTPRSDGSLIGQAMDDVSVFCGSDGRLTVASNAVGQTYWPNPEPELNDGHFQTADLGEIGSDGIRLVGRVTDVINVAGRKVSPERIEEAILADGSVRGCVVFGAPHPEDGEQIIAVVAVENSFQVSAMRQRLSTILPNWQIPQRFWVVDHIPTNARGKISRREWRERFQTEGGKKIAPETSPGARLH